MNKKDDKTYTISKEDYQSLYKAFLSVKNEMELKAFLEDLCTKKEVESFVLRLKAAQILLEGETYEEVIDKISISSTTLARVSKALKYGTGYKNILKK